MTKHTILTLRHNMWFRNITLCICLFIVGSVSAQEHVVPLRYNAVVHDAVKSKPAASFYRKTALSLPFFEDFTGYSIFPDSTKWVEDEVYVNNTMCISPISRGVATFDALNQYGLPYDTAYNTVEFFCDSLTSQPIDLGGYSTADSLYLSFFYQPQGNGFYPSTDDSLMLLMHKSNNDWVLVWGMAGTPSLPFQQVMVPLTDTSFFYGSFQFRFVNKAAFNYSGSTWNVDYIRLNAHRNIADTAVKDVAFTTDPTYMLNDYTYMPYRQFLANPSGELATQMSDSIQNNYGNSTSITYAYTAREAVSNTFLSSGSPVSTSMPLYSQLGINYPVYTATVPSPGIYNKVVFENKFYLQSPAGDNKINDTIIRNQVFDNYLAYDDGTAEKAYYLNLFPPAPGKIAVEFHLNQPDTMRGMAIYFGRQVPRADYKFLNLVVYKSLQGISGALYDDTVYFDNDILNLGYVDTINHFWYYKFSQPVPLAAGTFYACVFLPAFSGSDSMYFGLDVNRIGGNHAYYNVVGTWNSSSVAGAIMIRPLLGQPIQGTVVGDVRKQDEDWHIYPNPAHNELCVSINNNKSLNFAIQDVQGRQVLNGNLGVDHKINISALPAGVYFVRLSVNGHVGTSKKFVKE